MKRWISSKAPRDQPDESWLKALARGLRDWLDAFLGESSPSEDDTASRADGTVSVHVSSARGTPNQGPPPIPDLGEPTGQPLRHQVDTGPPEEWLALVREGAPGLLLPVEKGGTPWYRVSSQAIDQSESPGETSPSVPLSLSELQALQAQGVRERKPDGPLQSASDRNTSWVQSLKRRLVPRVFAARTEEEAVRPGGKRFVKALRGEHQSAIFRKRSASAPTPGWSADVEQRLSSVCHSAPADELRKGYLTEKGKPTPQTRGETGRPSFSSAFPGAMAPRSPRNMQPAQWQNASEGAPATQGREPMRSGAESGHDSSGPLGTFEKPEQTFFELERSRRLFQRQVPTSSSGPERSSSSLSSARKPVAPIGERDAARDLGKLSKQVLPTVPSLPDLGTLSSRRPATSGWNDPWPELPADQPVSIANWMEVLRNWERLRALDFEQRGGS